MFGLQIAVMLLWIFFVLMEVGRAPEGPQEDSNEEGLPAPGCQADTDVEST